MIDYHPSSLCQPESTLAMISSETKILLKRSGIPGRVPSLADLKLGEVGINYYDGKIFFRQENDEVGARIIEPGQGDDIGRTIFVTVNGNDNNSGLNERDSVRTIKKAAELAQFGDGIKVYPGHYIEDNPIVFRDLVAVEGMDLRNVLVTPANPGEDLYLVGDGFHATNHSFVSNQDSKNGAAIISFRRLEGTASDRYFDAARLIRDNLDFISGEAVGFLTSGYSGFAAGQRSQDGSRALELNRDFITEEAFQYINSPDYKGPNYTNPDLNQCRRDLGNILDGWRYDLISDGNSESTGVGLTYYAPIPFVDKASITDLVYDNTTGNVIIETDIATQIQPGDQIKLQDIKLDCGPYGNENIISGFSYDNVSGVGTVTLPFLHNILVGDTVKLDGLKFDCPPYGAEEFSIENFIYEETTGRSVIKLSREHSLKAGDTIELRDIQFDCPPYGGRFTNITNFEYDETSGEGIVSFEDSVNLSPGDTVQLYDIKFDCPPYGNAISVVDFDYDNFTGLSEVTLSSNHGLQPGDLVKFEDLKFTCDSYLEDSYNVTAFNYNNLTGESVVTLDSNHSFVTGDTVELRDLLFQCNSYTPFHYAISDFQYNNTTGVSVVSLQQPHNLAIGEQIRLAGLTFECNSYSFTNLDVVNAPYDNVTGFITIETSANHGQEVGAIVNLEGLIYSCNTGTEVYPDVAGGKQYEILSVPSPTTMIVNVGTSTIEHSYVSDGTATVGITTTLFPDGTQGFDFVVTDLIDQFSFEINVGVSTIAHNYVSGGDVFIGFTTTTFPDGTQGFDYTVTNVPANDQIVVNVGVSTIAHTYVSGGTASTVDRFLPIAGLEYDAASGLGTVSLNTPHNLVAGDSFILQDLTFTCDSYRAGTASTIAITNFEYDNVTGISTISLASSHDLNVNDSIALYDILVDCGFGTELYPDGSRYNAYPVLATPDPNTVVTRVGASSITHDYVSGGVMQVGITTNIFPDGTRPSGDFFQVIATPSTTEIITQIGVSSIAHTYASGGKFYSGITTNIFPQTFEDPNVLVTNAVYDNLTGVTVITTNKSHGLMPTDSVLLQGLEFSCTSGGPGGAGGSLIFPRNQEVYTVATVVSPTEYTVNIGTSPFVHTYVTGGTSTPQNINNAVYDRRSGYLTVTTTKQHGYVTGNKASVVDLLFSCQSGGQNNAPGQLLFPRPTDQFVLETISGTNLTINVGAFPGLVHTYVSGGSIRFGTLSVAVTAAIYNEGTGIVEITTSAPLGASAGDTVTMQGLEFSCLSGGPGNDPGIIVFPRLDVPYFPVVSVENELTYTIDVGTSTIDHTYVSGGFSSLKKRANDRNIFIVSGVPTPNSIVASVGVNSIPHTYAGGGNAFVGITTNIFPDGTRPDGFSFNVISALTENKVLLDVGSSTIPHEYESGGRMQYGKTNQLKIIDFKYNNLTGISTVIIQGSHALTAGQNVKLTDLEFTCTNSPGITTTIFPDGTAASLNIFPVTKVINNNTFETNVGTVAFEHTYLRGGSAFVGITTNIFPDGTQGFDYTVNEVMSDTEVIVDVGISSITHEYVRGGTLFAGRTNEREIADFDYNNVEGTAVLTFRRPEGNLFAGDLIKLEGLRFNCPNGSGITTNIFPDGSIGNIFPITQKLNNSQYELKIAPSTIPHTYVRGTGEAFVGITTNIFPDLTTQPSKLFEVVGVPSPNRVAVKIGVSSIPHEYEGGGKLSVGITTDIFPGDSQNSPLGDVFTVDAITKEGELLINVGVSSIAHSYIPGWSGGKVFYGESTGGELRHITGPGVKEATIAAIDFERQISEYAINNRPWGSFIAAETGVVDDILYNNVTGIATVVVAGINAQVGDLIRMSDIQFRCSDEYAGLTTTFFPDNTRPQGQYFTVDRRVDVNSFETFIGISSIPHNYNKGGNVYRYRQGISNVDYDRVSGLASVRSLDHGFSVGDMVEMGDIRFDCPVFTPDFDIENFQYDNLTGLSTVTTTVDNNIQVGDLVKLADIKLECPPYGNEIAIDDLVYSNVTGITTIVTDGDHGISLNPRTSIDVLSASYDNLSGIITVTTDQPINLNGSLNEGIVLNGLQFSCGVGTTSYPKDNSVYKIKNVINASTFELNVGVATQIHTYQGGGTATQVDRSDVKLANIKMDCPAYGNDIDITNFLYDNTSGNSLVTVDRPHGLSVGDDIKLANIKFQCAPYNNKFSVIDAQYTTATGIVTISTSEALGSLGIGDKVRVKGLQFDCNSGVDYAIDNTNWNPNNRTITFRFLSQPVGLQPGDSIKITGLEYRIPTDPSGTFPRQYPDGRDASLNIFECTSVTTSGGFWFVETIFPLLSEAGIVFLQSQGDLNVGVTTNIYPDTDNKEGGIFDVLAMPATNQVTIGVGSTAIGHTYVRFGDVFTGVTTNFYPDSSPQNSPKGNIFEVIDIPTPNQVRINVGVSTISHTYDEGGQLFVGITSNIFPGGVENSPNGDIFPVINVLDSTTLEVQVGQSTIPHNYISGGEVLTGITTNIFPGDKVNSPAGNIFKVLEKDEMCPDRFTINVGVSTIPHGYVDGGTVTTGVTTDKFPDGTNGFEFEVLSVLDSDNFRVNVGPSSITHNYIEGGYVRRIKSPVTGFNYTNSTGIATVSSLGHRLNIGDLVKLENIKFDCDPYGNEKNITDVAYNNLIGSMVVTTLEEHGLSVNDDVKLSGIQMDCPAYGNELGILAASYNNINGELFLQTDAPHGLALNDNVKLANLEFTCNTGTEIYPDGSAASNNIFRVIAIGGLTTLTVQLAPSTIVHTYQPGTGSLFVGITTNIFPGSAQNSPKGSILQVLDTPSINSFTVDVGISSIPHAYFRGGLVQTGVTTDIFPDGTQGEFFEVEEVIDEDTFIINSGVSSISHRYNSGGFISKYVTYQSKSPQVIDSRVTRVSGDCGAVVARLDQLAGIVTSIIDEGPTAAPGGVSVKVIGASYNGISGDLVVEVQKPISIAPNDIIKIQNLIFECQKTAKVIGASYDNKSGLFTVKTQTPHGLEEFGQVKLKDLRFACSNGESIYPTDPGKAFTVTKVIDKVTYEIELETSLTLHTYIDGGTSTSVPTARIFPDNKVFDYRVKSVLSNTSFIINVGKNDLAHTYVSGGIVFPGQRYDVESADFNTRTGKVTITTNRDNNFVADTGVQLNRLRFTCVNGNESYPDNRKANVTEASYNNVTGLLRVTTDKPHQAYRDAKITLEGLEFSCTRGTTIYPNGGNTPVTGSTYDNNTGLLTVVTATAHGLSPNSRVKLDGLVFSCSNGTSTYPTNPGESYRVASVLNPTTYTVLLATSTFVHTYVSGGVSSNADLKRFRVVKVVNDYIYEVQLEPSTFVHTYEGGGTSEVGPGEYRIDEILTPRTFTVQMAPNPIPHTYIGGGTAASVFTQQELTGINLRTAKCADDVKKIYLAVAHDITRGGNWKSVDAARRYYDAVGQYQHIAGGEVNQTVETLDYSLNIVRCVINNVSWGGVPRGTLTTRARKLLPLPKSTKTSVVSFKKAIDLGEFTTQKKKIVAFDYNNATGVATVTTDISHSLIKYNAIRLDDIQMRCVGSPRITTNIFPDGTQGDIFEVIEPIQDNEFKEIVNAVYENETGKLTVELNDPIDFNVGTLVNLRNIEFSCPTGIKAYPENDEYAYEVLEINGNEVLVNVGISTIQHTYVAAGDLRELPKKFTVHVGTVSFPHIYTGGGTVWEQEPFQKPMTATQLRDVSIQNDPLQLTNSTPNACANVFSAIENAIGVVTTIIDVGFEESGIAYSYPGNDGKGVPTMDQMSSQGVGNIIKGPYIRNCTNFVPKSIGMRMDGFDAEPGDEISNGVQGSSNVDSFTQFNPGGIGCSISNGTYQQLVSIFTICCDEAIVCDSGAQLDLTNSNSSFGRLGLVARGIGDAKSKCIDRYTGIVAEEALIEDDTVTIRGIGGKRPYDGQGIFFGELFREVVRIDVTDGGSGYDDQNPPLATVAEPTGPSGIKAEISPTVTNGVITSIEIISNGNQYRAKNPVVTIPPPRDPSGRQAKAVAITEPLYYDVDSSTAPEEGSVTVVFKQRLNNTVSVGTTVFFSRLSLQIASSHSFEYIGAGNEIDGARPSQGGVPIKENEVIKEDGGSIVYTSTDQAGNFNIGDDFVINQFTGTVTGRSFDQSVLNKVTPLIIALDS